MTVLNTTIETIPLSDMERSAGRPSYDTLQCALEAFHRDGIVILSGAIPSEPLEHLKTQMTTELPLVLSWPGVQYNQGKSARNVSQCPPLSHDFLHKDIWANDYCVAVLECLLGPKPQLTFVGGNTALPRGKDRQAVHSDVQPPYFGFVYGVEVNIYLSDVGPDNGSTEFWVGSHRISQADDYVPRSHGWIKQERLEERAQVCPPIQPSIPKGSIVLRDLRL